jgi:hypothetical protein
MKTTVPIQPLSESAPGKHGTGSYNGGGYFDKKTNRLKNNFNKSVIFYKMKRDD